MIAGYPVGGGSPPLFLAEIGALFNQEIDEAHRLIAGIAAARNDRALPLLLKGEILHDPSICLDDDTVETYQSRSGARRTERYRDLIERKVLSLESYAALLDRCREQGLEVVVSVYDAAGATFAAEWGVAAIKIASSNITHIPLIRHVAGLGRPIIVDSGRASLAEIDRAVSTAREAGAAQIVLEHSPDGHPAPPENHNLQTLATLRRAFDLPVGLSDHAVSEDMMMVAVGLGVDLIERNIAADPGRLEQDTAFSSGIATLSDLLVRLRDAWIALGRPFRDVGNRSGLISTSARMGLVTCRAVSAGERLDTGTIGFAFPCKGVPVEHYDLVDGREFARDLPKGAVIGWDAVRP